MTATVMPILVGAREILESPKSWTQGAFRRDLDGKMVLGYRSENTTCRCLVAALCDAGGGIPLEEAFRKLMEDAIKTDHLEKWNDAPSRTHDDILEALDGATELVRNAIESLIKTRELLSESSAWTKNAFRKDANGQSIKPGDTETVAACRCLIAAMSDANGRRVDKVARWAMQETTGSTALAEWNDDKDRTHSEVLDAIDKAIFLLRGD